MKAKPILFRTDMVRALLEARKTVTRRIIKYSASDIYKSACFHGRWHEGMYTDNLPQSLIDWYCKEVKRPPYEPGDILYVRETWCNVNKPEYEPEYYYFADTKYVEDYCPSEWKWSPSIHMPKEAARIFLKVTGVRAERLKVIIEDPPGPNNQAVREGFIYGCDFIAAWNRLIKPADLDKYGWDANPWVWVIEFKRINWEEAIRYSEL